MKNEFVTLSPGKTNCYLIQVNNGYLLIDTGYEKDYSNFLQKDNYAVEMYEKVGFKVEKELDEEYLMICKL